MEIKMINDKNINTTVSNISKCIENIVDGMGEGERLTTKAFIKKVVDETNVPVAIATGLTSLCVKNCNNVFQRSGRDGGIYKKTADKVIIGNENVEEEGMDEDDIDGGQ
jgi:hypothetical protein